MHNLTLESVVHIAVGPASRSASSSPRAVEGIDKELEKVARY